MSELLLALGWRPTGYEALRFVTTVGAMTLSIVTGSLIVSEGAGVPSIALQLALWAVWLGWLGVVFPRNRLRTGSAPCAHAYHLAFVRELLPGIGLNFALLLRPAAQGLLSGAAVGAHPLLALGGAVLLVAGLALIAAGTLAIGVARAFFVHEYVRRSGSLVVGGIYGQIRHPLFVGGVATSLGLALLVGASAGIALALVNLCILPVYVLLEDRRCTKVLGSSYERYRMASGAVIPLGWRPWKGSQR